MITEELKENIKKHYGNSDEDLKDLGQVMDALDGVDEVENLKRQLETSKIENEAALKKLDAEWRDRYRERFFDGDVTVPDVVDPLSDDSDDAEDVTIEDYIEIMKKEKI